MVIPLSLQRRVEGLLQEHLDRTQLVSGKYSDGLGDNNANIEDIKPYENEDSLVDRSVMEKILQRKSCRMRNAQRAWQVEHLSLLFYGFCYIERFSFK